jgi:Zn-dependent protease with chaperone function
VSARDSGKTGRRPHRRLQARPGRRAALVAAFVLATASLALAARTRLKPGWNLFSPQQDVQIGQRLSSEAQKQMPMLNDPRVDNYLNRLGHRLSAHAPGYRFPYQYRCVNSAAINAFALPGGYIYINRGVIEAADDEAQLAAVMAHETSHVALRHGTNQASKAYAWQVPFSILGGVMGSNSVGSVLAQLGGGFVVNSIFLKYSRTDESQADVLGTQILYDSGYDPRAMAQFFEKIEGENRSRPIEFFSDHPSPERRVERVEEEIDRLGGAPPGAQTDSAEFEQIKRYLKSLPPPPKTPSRAGGGQGARNARPEPPADRFTRFANNTLELDYPENWRSYGQGSTVTLAPDGGIVADRGGRNALAYGMLISVFESRNGGAASLGQATRQLVQQMERTNSRMNEVRRSESDRVGGLPALSTYLEGDSPVGGSEWDWLMTVRRPEGLLYFICVAPHAEADVYQPACRRTLNSVRFRE